MIKIGTRSSELALWQANTVARQLENLGHTTKIIKIDSLFLVISVSIAINDIVSIAASVTMERIYARGILCFARYL